MRVVRAAVITGVLLAVWGGSAQATLISNAYTGMEGRNYGVIVGMSRFDVKPNGVFVFNGSNRLVSIRDGLSGYPKMGKCSGFSGFFFSWGKDCGKVENDGGVKVSEPPALALLLMGLVGVVTARWLRRSKH